MKKPNKPKLPTVPNKPYGQPKKRLVVDNPIQHQINFYDRTTSVSSLIDELQALTNGKEPGSVMIKFETTYGYYGEGYYGETDLLAHVYEQIEIDNPNYDKQLDACTSKLAAYERKMKEHDALMKQYHIDIEQYDYDMKTYYDWVVAQKKDKGK